MAIPTITGDERIRRHVLTEEVRARFDDPDGRPTVEQRTPTGRLAVAHVSEVTLVYAADFEHGVWIRRGLRVRGCLSLADGTISTTERNIDPHRIPDGSWPAWFAEIDAMLNPGTFVSLLERPVVADPSTVVITGDMTAPEIEAAVDRAFAPVKDAMKALRTAAGQ
jgi:hypothetical protein